MSDTLEHLAELRSMLSKEPSETLCLSWWDRVLMVEASLEIDPNFSKNERETVAQLREGISDLILAWRNGQSLHISRASVAITSLEGSVKKRTTGEDGWPLA